MNREEWLNQASELFVKLVFSPEGYSEILYHISTGFPSVRGTSAKSKRIGECWSASASDDDKAHIFINPCEKDSKTVLAIVAHELVHAAVGTECGHRGEFAKLGRAINLEGKLTESHAGPVLEAAIDGIIELIGEYPHAKLNAEKSGKKKQTTRMLKLECYGCGYVIRTTAKWLAIGIPSCCCGEEFEEERDG